MAMEQSTTTPQHTPDVQSPLAVAGGAVDTDLITAFVATVLRSRDLERGDLKVMHRAVRELRYALSVFARYRHVRKVTVFGSARAHPSHPAYGLALWLHRATTPMKSRTCHDCFSGSTAATLAACAR